MAKINVPAYCPTCGAIFPSGFRVGGNVPGVRSIGGKATCPNGHIGEVIDGTFDFAEGMMFIRETGPNTARIVSRILEISTEAERGEKPPEQALDEIEAIAPPEVLASVKQLRRIKPLVAVKLIAKIAAGILGVGASGAGIYDVFFEPDPAPQIIINNDTTIINEATPHDPSGEPVPKPVKREQLQRLKQVEKQKEKLGRQGQSNAEKERRGDR